MTCPHCGRPFVVPSLLAAHVILSHPISPRRRSRRDLWLAMAILSATLGGASADLACQAGRGVISPADAGWVVVTPPPFDADAGYAR